MSNRTAFALAPNERTHTVLLLSTVKVIVLFLDIFSLKKNKLSVLKLIQFFAQNTSIMDCIGSKIKFGVTCSLKFSCLID